MEMSGWTLGGKRIYEWTPKKERKIEADVMVSPIRAILTRTSSCHPSASAPPPAPSCSKGPVKRPARKLRLRLLSDDNSSPPPLKRVAPSSSRLYESPSKIPTYSSENTAGNECEEIEHWEGRGGPNWCDEVDSPRKAANIRLSNAHSLVLLVEEGDDEDTEKENDPLAAMELLDTITGGQQKKPATKKQPRKRSKKEGNFVTINLKKRNYAPASKNAYKAKKKFKGKYKGRNK